MEAIQHHVDTLFDSSDDLSDCTTAFMIAYRLEFYMMHPAFEALFHLMRKETGDVSPEDSYQHHIRGLFNTMKKCKSLHSEFEFILELMERLL